MKRACKTKSGFKVGGRTAEKKTKVLTTPKQNSVARVRDQMGVYRTKSYFGEILEILLTH